MSRMEEIIKKYGEEYILRQLAEECAELAQAALKLIRARRKETPMREDEAREHLVEELADVYVLENAVYDFCLTEDEKSCMDCMLDIKENRMYERMLDKGMEEYRW